MDLITKATELVENLKQFAKNRKVDNVLCLFDFIPDEILSMIIKKTDDIIDVSHISKRFYAVHLSNCISNIKVIYSEFVNKNPNWVKEICGYKNIIGITKRALILGLSLSTPQREDIIELTDNDDKYCMRYHGLNDIYEYELRFTSGFISTSAFVKRTHNEYIEDDEFNHNEVISNDKSFSSVGNIINDYNYICTMSKTPFIVVFKNYMIISNGTKQIITPTASLSKHTFNSLEYHLPKKDHPKYKEIMEIINGENSPIPIDTFDYMPY